jgi:glycosyltransferase involved in cell wall biosynthesis
MTILICIPCLLTGGTEIQTLNLVQALIRGGHKVVAVCYFEYSRSMVSRYESSGCKVVCLSETGTRTAGVRSMIFLYNGLRKVVKKYRPTVAHVQYMAPGAIPILVLRLLGMKRIIATAHTSADIYSNLRLVHFIQKHIVRAFTCITQRAEESFFASSLLYDKNVRLERRNHFTIYNALPDYIRIRESKKSFCTPLTLGVVSRLETIKGMDLVIPAYSRLKIQYPDLRLIIVGDGSLAESMKKQAMDLSLENNIVWYGRQEQDKLQALYEQIDILLMPSRSEGFGLTAIEAMACGCVVVASDTGGLPEIVRDNKIGLLHKPESIEDIVVKINKLLEDKQLLELYSEASIKHVKQYNFEKYASLFNNLYSKI